MERKWIFIVGVAIVIILTGILFLDLVKTTGSIALNACWEKEVNFTEENGFSLKAQGCILDEKKACCPFPSCPENNGLNCNL